MKRSMPFNTTLISHSIFTPGSMSWKLGWLQDEQPSKQGDILELLNKANQLIQSADNKEKVLELMDTYENALKIDSKNREALTGAAQYSCLIGIGYSDKNEEKRTYFLKTINRCEQIMYLNNQFAALVDNDEQAWEACRVLSKIELEALWFFYLGVSSLWKDCLSVIGKIINIKWTKRGKILLKNMMEIDPEWNAGTPYYGWANYYAAAPSFAGGDLKKAEEYYCKAIEMGPEMLNFRRTRALLLHTKNKDKEAFKKDLMWVLSQDPKKTNEFLTYPWRVFLQRDSQYMLDHIDDYFK